MIKVNKKTNKKNTNSNYFGKVNVVVPGLFCALSVVRVDITESAVPGR